MRTTMKKIALIALTCIPLTVMARGGGHGGGSHSGHSGSRSSHSGSYSSHSGSRSNHTGYHSRSGTSTHSTTRSSTAYSRHNGHGKAVGVMRDSHGRIQRSAKAKNDFKQQHPCPANGKHSGSCPGYVIDHVVPLKRGGRDAPSNMQWQTVRDAKAKDKTE